MAMYTCTLNFSRFWEPGTKGPDFSKKLQRKSIEKNNQQMKMNPYLKVWSTMDFSSKLTKQYEWKKKKKKRLKSVKNVIRIQ